jgi:hypothetical protein
VKIEEGSASGAGRVALSERIVRIADQTGDRMRIGDLTEAFGDHVFGALLVIFALPNVFPLPPGSSTVFAIPLLLITAQMALGRKSLWLPKTLADKTISKEALQRLSTHGAPILKRAERRLLPRLGALVNDRLVGIICFLLAVVLVLPIPLGNMPPGLAISAFGLGLLYKDGLAVLAGFIATAASLVIVALVSGAVLLGARYAFAAAWF